MGTEIRGDTGWYAAGFDCGGRGHEPRNARDL